MYNTMYLIFTNLWFNIKMNCVYIFFMFHIVWGKYNVLQINTAFFVVV